jgi:hypothetical protein
MNIQEPIILGKGDSYRQLKGTSYIFKADGSSYFCASAHKTVYNDPSSTVCDIWQDTGKTQAQLVKEDIVYKAEAPFGALLAVLVIVCVVALFPITKWVLDSYDYGVIHKFLYKRGMKKPNEYDIEGQ